MSLWLIRNHRNELLGPVSQEELISWIREGKVTAEDEVCATNRYWIHLDERDEVASQLGIEMPRPGRRSGPDGEEITLTDTTEIEHIPASAIFHSSSKSSTGADTVPLSTQSAQYIAQHPHSHSRTHRGGPIVVGRAETIAIWRIAAFLLVVMTGGFVYWILKILQEAAVRH